MVNMSRRLFLKIGAAIPAIAALPTLLKASVEPKKMIFLDTENGSWSSGRENVENIRREGIARLQLHQSRLSDHVDRHGKWTLTYPEGEGQRVIILGDKIDVKMVGCRPRATLFNDDVGPVTSYDPNSRTFQRFQEIADTTPWGQPRFAQYGPEFEFEITQRKWIERIGHWTHWDHRCHYFAGSKTAKRAMWPLVAWRDHTPELGATIHSCKVVSRKFTWWQPEIHGIYVINSGLWTSESVYECPWLETANGLG